MYDHITGEQRRLPAHVDEAQDNPVEDTQETEALQPDAAVQERAVAELESQSPVDADYTISVDQVREHFRQRGLTKSKDTIQRWCRTGELDCRKQGIFNRYFTTETSLLALEEKLLPDLIAEQVGVPKKSVRADAGAIAIEHPGTQVNTAATTAASSNAKVNASSDQGARSGTSEHAAVNSNEGTYVPLHADAELAELRARASGLETQLAQANGIIAFLQDEIVSSRGQRGDVVKIAEQMLGTLETIAVGGRLEKPSGSPSQPVRYEADELDRDRV